MKKRVFTVALALCLAAIVGFGTLAYFQSQKQVTNYFAVAGVTDPTDPDATINTDELFSIKLEETVVGGTGKTETGNTYTDILPGDVLVKDPTVTNTGKYDAWVRVKVVISDAAAWQTACAAHNITKLDAIFGGYDETKWTRYDDPVKDTAADTLTYVFYLNDPLTAATGTAAAGSATLFSSFTVPGVFTVEEMSALATFNIEITAEAIQVRNTADNAKDAFGAAYWVEPTA